MHFMCVCVCAFVQVTIMLRLLCFCVFVCAFVRSPCVCGATNVLLSVPVFDHQVCDVLRIFDLAHDVRRRTCRAD